MSTPEERLFKAIELDTAAPSSTRSRFSYEEVETLADSGKKFKEHNLARGDRNQGTKFSGICFHCKNHFAYRTRESNEPVLLCNQMPGKSGPLPLTIIECSDYSSVTDLTLSQMAQLAWPIETRDYLKEGYR